ncbi:hypothetical protein BaRGS_00009498 [Batillaria attramentaria]|uniref:Receptor for retinol uptake STRA6 n=1 Tax=Batillaria attramentaria TaxID=370345 RepID=A0ABD0LIJ6_9CAEN
MASGFLNSFNSLLNIARTNNATNATGEACESAIDYYLYHQLVLIPAAIITLSFAVTKQRRNILLSVLKGRPGLVYPMDSLTRSSRISYACAFGATAFLVYKIVLEQQYAIKLTGATSLRSFIALASMFIYGMMFFPLFTSLAIGSTFGYGLGALYVWMLTAVEIFRLTECNTDLKGRILLVFRNIPSVLCLLYLSVSIPARMILAARKGRFFVWEEDVEETNTLDDIRASYAGHHVAKLLRKPEITPPPEGRIARIKVMLYNLTRRFLYVRQKGFRYPSRILSVMLVGTLVVYTLTYEFLTLLPPLFDLFSGGLIQLVEATVGLEPQPGESEEEATYRTYLFVAYWIIDTTKICVIVANVVATVLSLFNVLHMLSNYRANLLALYRGDHSHIPPAANFSCASHCVNSIKYAGFQVGYIIWAYMIQFIILSLICVIVAVIYILVTNDFTSWLLWFLNLIWPIILTALVIAVGQLLLARFVFLQERGAYLALNNRNLYFIFTYFMFFYNIFLGLVSCLIRILKAMVLGIVFLCRLDNSTLPRRFEFLDPGFKAYVGYMQMEYAHTHPVVVVFTRIMYLGLHNKQHRRVNTRQASGTKGMENGRFQADVKIEMAGPEDEARKRRSMAARFNWYVIYTLLHNPDIRVMRKGYMQMLRQARLLGVNIPVSDRQADVDFEQLQDNIQQAKDKMAAPSGKKNKVSAYEAEEDVENANIPVQHLKDKNEFVAGPEDEARKKNKNVAWYVIYTLLHNPDIRVMRKGYMQMLRQARLLGVNVPVSDRQADVGVKQLHDNIQHTKDKMAFFSMKKNKVSTRCCGSSLLLQ